MTRFGELWIARAIATAAVVGIVLAWTPCSSAASYATISRGDPMLPEGWCMLGAIDDARDLIPTGGLAAAPGRMVESGAA